MDLSSLFDLIPQPYGLYVAGLVILCSIVTSIVQPPKPDSRWVIPYKLASIIALNVGWAKNQYRPGFTGKMVPREQSRDADAALTAAEIKVKKAGVLPFARSSSNKTNTP